MMHCRFYLPILILVATASFCDPADAQQFIDDFNGNLIAPNAWTVTIRGSGPQVTAANQRIEISIPAESAQSPGISNFSGTLTSTYVMRGDFDVQVDYRTIEWPLGNGVRLAIGAPSNAMERTSLSPPDQMGGAREVYLTDFSSSLTTVNTTDQAGTLRLVRIGAQYSGYFRTTAGWSLVSSRTGSTGDAQLRIAAWSHDYDFMNKNVKCAFDNFVINQGQIVHDTAGICLRIKECLPADDVVPAIAQLSGSPSKSLIEAPVVGGFATFTAAQLASHFAELNSSICRIDILDGSSPRKLIGHIGLNYTVFHYSQEVWLDCFVFLHDEKKAEGANSSQWGYYGEYEHPVTMLVPPGGTVTQVHGGDQLPILFVHGVRGTFDYWGATPAIADQAQKDSWQFYYPYDQHLDESAAMLQEASTQLLQGQLYPARAYNVGQMSIVTHSMGGLVVRRALETPAFASQVHRVMMFAPPNHGSYVAWRLAYDDYGLDTFLAELGEYWTTHDPEAPAYEEMAPASDWLRALNLTAPPRLDSGPVSSTYLVIAGIDDIAALPHREMESQDDGVVSVSSASLTKWGIPLVIANEDHRNIHKSRIARDLLPWVWDGIATVAGIPNASDEELCIQEVAGAAECAGVTGMDTGLGLITVKIDRPPSGTTYYSIDGIFNGVLRLTKNGILKEVDSERELHRVAVNSEGFFSRCRRQRDHAFDYREIAHWLTPNTYPVELYEDGQVSRSLTPLTITHLGTTTGVILRTPGSSLACNAPSSSRVPPIEDKIQHSYAWTVDDHVDTLIFTLTAENMDPVLMPHGLVLADPLGNLIDEAVAASDPNITMFTESDSGPIRYMIETPQPGLWTIRHEAGLAAPVLMAGIYSEVFADLELDRPEYAVGDSLGVVVSLTGGASLTERAVSVSAVLNPVNGGSSVDMGEVHLVETTPDQWRGALPDAAAGQYELVLTMTGTEANSAFVTRTDMQTAWVSSAISDVTAVPGGPSDREDVPSPSLALSIYPNPFNASTDIHFDLPQTQHVDLAIYAIDGRRVVSLADGVMEGGPHSMTWRGVDGSGRPTASGVYFVVLRTADGAVTSKTALLK